MVNTIVLNFVPQVRKSYPVKSTLKPQEDFDHLSIWLYIFFNRFCIGYNIITLHSWSCKHSQIGITVCL